MTDQFRRSLRDDAWRIWLAGLDAVRAEQLVEHAVRREGDWLTFGDPHADAATEVEGAKAPLTESFDAEDGFVRIDLRGVRRIVVVGAGKAGAGMAAGLEAALGQTLLTDKQVAGWVNVPADCVRTLSTIHLHAARPAGLNEPCAEGVAGTEAMLRMVAELGPDDLCVALISGGGSALLPAPAVGVSLADKLAVTRVLSAAGANIEQLNTVRKQLSRVKGGGLARACNAGRLVTIIISDVLGDPLDVIASGPTVENTTTAADALEVLRHFGGEAAGISPGVFELLRHQSHVLPPPMRCRVANLVIGNNALAVDAAGMEAERLGYSHAMDAARSLEGEADDVGRRLAHMAQVMSQGDFTETVAPATTTPSLVRKRPDCLITGGEPVVRLAPSERRGLGGRNQQLVLAAVVALESTLGHKGTAELLERCAILSAGTDGEDGPTDAAGAVVDGAVYAQAKALGLDAADFIARNDAYHYFAAAGGLLKTGPTHTNVCDVRVVVVRRSL